MGEGEEGRRRAEGGQREGKEVYLGGGGGGGGLEQRVNVLLAESTEGRVVV